MNWIFYIPDEEQWDKKTAAEEKTIYLRPFWEMQGKNYTSGVVELQFKSTAFLNNALSTALSENQDGSLFENLLVQLKHDEFFPVELDLSREEKQTYISRIEVFVRNSFDYNHMMELCRKMLQQQDFPFKQLKKTDSSFFLFDINPFYRAFNKNHKEPFDLKLPNQEWIKKFVE